MSASPPADHPLDAQDAEDGHDCRKSVGFSHERGNYCKVCDRFILNAEIG